jgi:hypothetical protein
MEADMKVSLGRVELLLAAVILAALAFISWQVNQTAHAMAAMSVRPHIPFVMPAPLNPSLSSHLQAIPYCDGGERAENGSHGDGADNDGDDDGGPYNDEPDDPSQDVFPT